ncbi:hypothetical protein KHU50_012439 [Colletotrichum sp. SAR 10_65]|nr:hypothetical protein KHU50_012439 [Colletotrichum sp. SAR 10_65]KAJ4998317.1 hypothetical protein K4K48_005594 [Colletotrichum sp. SAR 10_66]
MGHNEPHPHGDEKDTMTEQERKRLRNRLSQQAFRRRQQERIRELSNRVNTDQKPEDERVAALQQENRQLRAQLVEVQTRLSRLMANLQGLNDTVSKTLNDTASGGSKTHEGPNDTGALPELINAAGISPLYNQIPNIWSFEYQTGVEPYQAAMAATQESSLALRKNWTLSNSPFSDHIQLLQRLIYQPVLMVLSMFNSMTRPDVMAWYAKTRFFHIIELTAWQLYPSAATFDKLHQRYRPTEAQMKHPHPRVIDWIPFPSIRDRLIQLHAANPHIDQIFCDAVTGYVVETTMSDLVRGAPDVTVYIRVTDLITAMSTTTADEDADATAAAVTLPAPDVTALFSSPAYARAAFKQLNMDKGASYYKIDPAFYAKYPELFDHANDLTATGVPLRPKSQKVLTYPRPLDASTVETYRSFIDFSLDASQTISS